MIENFAFLRETEDNLSIYTVAERSLIKQKTVKIIFLSVIIIVVLPFSFHKRRYNGKRHLGSHCSVIVIRGAIDPHTLCGYNVQGSWWNSGSTHSRTRLGGTACDSRSSGS